jgi:hypothetical protein
LNIVVAGNRNRCRFNYTSGATTTTNVGATTTTASHN